MRGSEAVPVEAVEARAYRVPTEEPESDGTLAWEATVLVAVHVRGGGRRGFGYTYASAATARLVSEVLAPAIAGADALDLPGCHLALRRAVRNLGRGGIAALAVSAVDVALWDLKGRVLDVSLARLLGAARDAAPAYGSGGFTSYPVARLRAQLAGWVEGGFGAVKMKVGRDPGSDPARVAAAREAIGPAADLMVDANGAYDRKGALAMAERFAALGVGYFEEPVPQDDVAGLRLVRDRAPPGVRVAAGEYAWEPRDLRRLLEAGAVDVLQADATRCGGITGFLTASALAEAAAIPLSSHCAPALHAALVCAAPTGVHLEWFHDHARLEGMLFDGAPVPRAGRLAPARDRPGLGLELKAEDAERFAV